MPEDIKSIPVTFASQGVVTKNSPDEIALQNYKALFNAYTTRENSLTVRRGFTRLNNGLPAAPHSSYYLKDYTNQAWRYAITNGQLYVAPVTNPNDSSVWPISWGTDFEVVTGGGSLSSGQDPRAIFTTSGLYGSEIKSYMFMADGAAFLKHPGGVASARRVGIPRPSERINSIVIWPHEDVVLENCDEDISVWTGGNPSIERAPDSPSIWWRPSEGSLGAAYLYIRYTFNTATDEMAASSSFYRYRPSRTQARCWWRPDRPNQLEGMPLVGFNWGDFWYDYQGIVPENVRPRRFIIYAGDLVDSIQVVYETNTGQLVYGPKHGGGGGNYNSFDLDFDEYVIGIEGKYGEAIDSIRIVTNKRTSPTYGGGGGDWTFSQQIPEPEDVAHSHWFAGFHGKSQETDGNYVITAIGFTFWSYGPDWTATPPVEAESWNLYVGTSSTNLRKVNTDPIPLDSWFDEPITGFSFTTTPPFYNVGVVTSDPSGYLNSAVQVCVTGDGISGRTSTYLKDLTTGYCEVKDLGALEDADSIKLHIKIADAESKSNLFSIEVRFWLSKQCGDIGAENDANSQSTYYAYATLTDFASFTPGAWTQVEITKGEFILHDDGGTLQEDVGWNTVSGISLTITTIDPATGGKNCCVSFDNILYSAAEKLTGTDFIWTYTYYNSRTNTESDYAELYHYSGELTQQQVKLYFPPTPTTTPPLADPDWIYVYRQGATLEQFQYVGRTPYIPGAERGAIEFIDNTSDAMAGDVMETDNQLPPDAPDGVVAYDNRLWTWGGSYNGVPEPINKIRFSKNVRVESFPAENYIYVELAEKVLRLFEHDAELFIWTTARVWRVVGSQGQYIAKSTPVNQGIMSRFGVCRGLRALYMRAYDGVYEFPAGRKISEPINNTFIGGETVNEYPPAVKGLEYREAIQFHDNKVYLSYPTGEAGIESCRTWVWDTLYERWHHYLYGNFNLFAEPETNILVGDTLTGFEEIVDGVPHTQLTAGAWPMELENGYVDVWSDATRGIPWLVDTKEYDLGMPDQEKRFIDFVLDSEPQGCLIIVEIASDQESSEPGIHERLGHVTGMGRVQSILPWPQGTGESTLIRRMQMRITSLTLATASAQLVIYKIIHRILIEPPRHRTFVTAWSDYGVPTPKFFRELWAELNTFGFPLQAIEIHLDNAVAQVLQCNTTSTERMKFFFGLIPDLRGTLGRIKVIPTGEHEVKLYDHGFQVLPEPPVLNTQQTPYSDEQWPYNKLWKHTYLDIDTMGNTIGWRFWLDGKIVDSFDIKTDTRLRVTHSLPKDSLGKLGRLTVDESCLDDCCNPIGFRYYSHGFIHEKMPADVTLADSYVQLLNYDRQKVIRRFWMAVRNPDGDVDMEIWVDGTLRVTETIPMDPVASGYSKRRVDLMSTLKGYAFRIIFSSPFKFEIHWDQSEVEMKTLNAEDGYARVKLVPPQTM